MLEWLAWLGWAWLVWLGLACLAWLGWAWLVLLGWAGLGLSCLAGLVLGCAKTIFARTDLSLERTNFTGHMPLLTAASAFRLSRRHWTSVV